jgi:GNAT superfamily N-acetyltransferase
MYDIRIADLSDKGLNALAELLKLVWPDGQFDAGFLDWAYRRNPAGEAVGFDAFHGDELVGHFGMMPYYALIDGQKELGLLAVHALIRAEHRRKGIYSKLALKTVEECRECGFSFITAFANAQSTPFFLDLMKFQMVMPLDVRLGIGPMRFRKKKSPVYYERLWEKDSIEWRLSRPGNSYAVTRKTSQHVFWADTGTFGVQARMGSFDGELSPGFLPTMSSLNPVRLWIGLDPDVKVYSSAYLPVPVALRPAPLNFVFKDLRGNKKSFPTNRSRILLMDFDAY